MPDQSLKCNQMIGQAVFLNRTHSYFTRFYFNKKIATTHLGAFEQAPGLKMSKNQTSIRRSPFPDVLISLTLRTLVVLILL